MKGVLLKQKSTSSSWYWRGVWKLKRVESPAAGNVADNCRQQAERRHRRDEVRTGPASEVNWRSDPTARNNVG